ncbi:Fur-regulated basic protein FbpA [Weizmannia acidilactici]|uniref:Fur-regulated basic protein FbpA n=1 Tax=Weizmannia acidilactici TaxID=2607726 RepID=UPI0012702890|nr:Fur-regulated basic protein FbpA [Weizmannia acidilactici]GER73885.1 hypothetical protein BpPP18_19520 [Weizmannia acidilactici]
MEMMTYSDMEERKNDYIEKLLEKGIYKVGKYQLYELPLLDLQKIYHNSFENNIR